MRVLLVEDTLALRRLFARLLRGRGIEVREAEDGLEALGCLAEFTPDVVLTDLMMPVMDGFAFIRQFRSIPAFVSVPVVAMTAMTSADAEPEARQAGATDVLQKPLESGALLDRIGRYCAEARP